MICATLVKSITLSILNGSQVLIEGRRSTRDCILDIRATIDLGVKFNGKQYVLYLSVHFHYVTLKIPEFLKILCTPEFVVIIHFLLFLLISET